MKRLRFVGVNPFTLGPVIVERTIQKSWARRNLPAGRSEILKNGAPSNVKAPKLPDMWFRGDLSSANVPKTGSTVTLNGVVSSSMNVPESWSAPEKLYSVVA